MSEQVHVIEQRSEASSRLVPKLAARLSEIRDDATQDYSKHVELLHVHFTFNVQGSIKSGALDLPVHLRQ